MKNLTVLFPVSPAGRNTEPSLPQIGCVLFLALLPQELADNCSHSSPHGLGTEYRRRMPCQRRGNLFSAQCDRYKFNLVTKGSWFHLGSFLWTWYPSVETITEAHLCTHPWPNPQPQFDKVEDLGELEAVTAVTHPQDFD